MGRTKAKYLKNHNLLEYSKGRNCPWQWLKLMDLRETFVKGTRWQVGNGREICFWKDRWLYHTPLCELGLLPSQDPTFDENITVDKFISNSQWNRNLLRQVV